MQIFKEIRALKAFLKEKKSQNQSIGFVPTMGALHRGHLNLVAESKKGNSITVCSIFVNPTQFNNPTDLEKYPRTPEHDAKLLEQGGCDILFLPETAEMYSGKSLIKFDFAGLDKILEGTFRPGHFSGVALVVSKFFNIVQPTRAYFGQKDFQQFKIISMLVRDLNFDLELICVPTTREVNGLALSSRNARLTKQDRAQATVLHQSLLFAHDSLAQKKKLSDIKPAIQKMFDDADVRLEYFELADQENLNLLDSVYPSNPAVLLVAAYVGEVRLIDNMLVEL